MGKLLTSTAMCIIFATGLHGVANASETNASVICENASTAISALTVAPDLFRGDFQKLALTSTPDGMYSGWGSRKIPSIILERY